MTAASQTLQPLPTQVGRLQSDLQQEPYAQETDSQKPANWQKQPDPRHPQGNCQYSTKNRFRYN
ncbi:hypothetical protein ABBQ32_006879 [Trebouxia sp. C0010 RCD-2024]